MNLPLLNRSSIIHYKLSGEANKMNKLSLQKRAQIIGLLVEGNSMRAASRLADCSINNRHQAAC